MRPNPMSRRTLLHGLTGLGALALASACSNPDAPAPSSAPSGTPEQAAAPSRRFGAEWEPHARTFMSWPASTGIWGEDLGGVRADIARLAQAIAGFEPVVLLARPEQAEAAQRACGKDVEVVPIPVDDLWARDTVPVFVEEGGKVSGVDFHFNGWGKKQQHDRDGKVAAAVLAKYGIPGVATPLVGEGGSFETDGQGTLMVTESSMVNDNRNPGMSRDQIEAELKKALGVRKVIWFAGVRGEDITDAHVDSLVRFAASGAVLLDQAAPGTPPDSWSRSAAQAKTVLKDATDANGKKLEVVELVQPDPDQVAGYRDTSVISYVNFYVANKALIVPRFGDRQADDRAQQVLRDHFPGREIVPVAINNIAGGGGGIHCATHDQPGTPESR
ncbi:MULTISPECIES: agmatine deiminase family protein [unclassified Crossiella]|uniref:agmatine deiminase family protein n=1 Tax=unclassified Crossiella TaxID=2620835 RepID=UPI001FFF9C5E|nr:MULTISPECIES: agmatine deiminase family protein [unclassified Crossiella]MCK2239038.1 agmatine deiminase family protein [Crossiella sp. S99.2]MCK2251393.1 agmatine deiminase family protein [Crossiella sp. S99.1]